MPDEKDEKITAARRTVSGASFESDTSGTDPIRGTRHVAAEPGNGLVDQDENLKETIANDGRAPQADIGLASLERSAKDAGGAPTNKAAGTAARKR